MVCQIPNNDYLATNKNLITLQTNTIQGWSPGPSATELSMTESKRDMILADNQELTRLGLKTLLAGFEGCSVSIVEDKAALIKETSILDTIQFCPCFAVSGLARACFCSKPA